MCFHVAAIFLYHFVDDQYSRHILRLFQSALVLACDLVDTPALHINHLKNRIENFVQGLKVQFHDLSIYNEKLTNLNNDNFCYLTKIELEILTYLIRKKETSKNFIKENILNIKSNIETNSLESHLSRIRKKMNAIKTKVKIQTKNEKLLITT